MRDRHTREPAKEETQRVLAECHRRGLLILSAGVHGNVIRLLTPLVATEDQIEEGLLILEAALVMTSRTSCRWPQGSSLRLWRPGHSREKNVVPRGPI
jgi:adenosylmethionine-8-amino-7-oxononanoate aminotransferase